MIEISNLNIETRFVILENQNFVFDTNEIYGIIAPNGSGKTTLFRTLTGLNTDYSGDVFINEKSNSHAGKSFFYFESSAWFDLNMTGIDYLKLIKTEYHSATNILDILTVFDMFEFANLPIKKYSLGMKQKLLISLYLISDADYLIMDEITNGLDDTSREIFVHIINHLQKTGKTVLISSHYEEDLQKICTKFVELKDKKLVNK